MRIGKAHVSLTLHRHKMNVRMRHLKTQDTLSHLDTRDSLADSDRHLLGKDLQARDFLVAEIKDIILLALRDYQGMSLLQRIYIEKGKIVLILSNLIARNLASNYT